MVISIHAPRTGSDIDEKCIDYVRRDFNPRSPHGERPLVFVALCGTVSFQSTLPARGATAIRRAVSRNLPISIHAPRTGSDTQSTAPRF